MTVIMSVVKISKYGWLISHENFIKETYKNIDNASDGFELKPELFHISKSYKPNKVILEKHKKTETQNDFYIEVNHVKEVYTQFYDEIKQEFTKNDKSLSESNNDSALQIATSIYVESGRKPANNLEGGNNGPAITKRLQESIYLFPENCTFYCKDVLNLEQHLNNKFDLILLDPPWWNKYIRRKRKHTGHAYNMMYNNDLKSLPLENYLNDDGLIVVWCTNSIQNLETLKNEILPKWGVKYVAKWYWIKITTAGQTICPFAPPPRKQPFEQIIFGCKENRSLPNPPNSKLVVSVPSALHSHKPPLTKLLDPFLSDKPVCLEIFARYLLPNWTSYGNEALRLQHECLYRKVSV